MINGGDPQRVVNGLNGYHAHAWRFQKEVDTCRAMMLGHHSIVGQYNYISAMLAIA